MLNLFAFNLAPKVVKRDVFELQSLTYDVKVVTPLLIFKSRGAGYESVYYGINNTRPK